MWIFESYRPSSFLLALLLVIAVLWGGTEVLALVGLGAAVMWFGHWLDDYGVRM